MKQIEVNNGSPVPIVSEFFHERVPCKRLDDLVLPPLIRKMCTEVIEEHRRADELQAHGLQPRHRLLLSGPPGNGKTSVAEALATALTLPLWIVRYEQLVGDTLSDIMQRMHQLFTFVERRRGLLFFDEFDTLGKERADPHDVSDLKRAVGPLLVHMDHVPAQVLLVTATNHLELLDHAVWRRFQVRLHLPRPTATQIMHWFAPLDLPAHYRLSVLVDRLSDASFAELEEFRNALRARQVLTGPNADMGAILDDLLAQWSRRLLTGGYAPLSRW